MSIAEIRARDAAAGQPFAPTDGFEASADRAELLAHLDAVTEWLVETIGYPFDMSTPGAPLPKAVLDEVARRWAERPDGWPNIESALADVYDEADPKGIAK